MEVVVVYGGKKYQYLEVNQITTWVDESKLPVPVMLHSILREKALASGIDPSVFICNNIKISVPAPNSGNSDKSKKQKNKIQGVINPFKN